MRTETKTTFNLLTEPWIPVHMVSGEYKSTGLIELFRSAEKIADLSPDSPLTRVSLIRFLLAILYRTHHGNDGFLEIDEDWLSLWNDGWDLDAIISYLKKWEDRFDLFSERYPFYQRSDLDLGEKYTPITKLSNVYAAGNNKQLFDHSADLFPPALSPAQAAMLLLEAQCWGIGGGVASGGRPNFTSASMPKGATLLVSGENLRDTLLLNLVPVGALDRDHRRLTRVGAVDLPAWERAGDDMIDKRPIDGPADYLTWQLRYIRLLPEEDGSVRHVYFTQGEKIDDLGSSVIDPMHTYRLDKKGPIPRGLQPDRAVWRDAESIFANLQEKDFHTAVAVEFIAGCRDLDTDRPIPSPLPVFVGGVAIPGGQPPPDLWCAERFLVPPSLITESDGAYRRLKEAMDAAREGAKILTQSMYIYASEFLATFYGSADPDAAKKLRDALCREADYWGSLESPFHQLLPQLGDESTEATVRWAALVREQAIRAFEASLNAQDSTGRHLRAATKARRAFYGRLKSSKYLTKKEVANDGENGN